jgi:hypothetical protein
MTMRAFMAFSRGDRIVRLDEGAPRLVSVLPAGV